VAASGAVETTLKAQEFNINGLIFVDLPGGGTTRFPFDEYLDTVKVARYDAFVLVVSKRILESDLELFTELKQRTGKKIHIVRTMIDQDIENANHDGLSPELVFPKIRHDLESKFGLDNHCWLTYPIMNDFHDGVGCYDVRCASRYQTRFRECFFQLLLFLKPALSGFFFGLILS
jgi:hypothetical protein